MYKKRKAKAIVKFNRCKKENEGEK